MSCPNKVDTPVASEYESPGGFTSAAPRPLEGAPEAGAAAGGRARGTADPIEGEKGSDHLPAPSEAELHAEHMYARFTEGRKRVILGIVAFAALLAPFSFSSFLPSISFISDDLHTTPTIINISVATFIVMIGITPLFWSVLSRIYGRRPIYCVTLPIYTLGCLGVARSPTLASLIISRIIQGAGSCAVLSLGAGTIGDLYPRERRGNAMGVFSFGALIGASLAPIFGGLLTQYVHDGWRAMQYLLMAMGALVSLLVFLFLPETAHSRVVDALVSERKERRMTSGERKTHWWDRWTTDFVFVAFNPVAPIALLKHPHILAMSLNSGFVMLSTYTILVPLSQTLAPRYNITNLAVLGCFYLCQGLGNLIASRLIGFYCDYTLKRWKTKRQGVYVPEDRLRASLIGGGLIFPMTVVALGWTLEKGSGKGGIAAAVILLTLNGIGLMMVLTPVNTYCVDVMQDRSAEVIAVNNAVRYILSGAASAFALPLIDAIGAGWANTFAACLTWLGFGLVLLTIRHGERMRSWRE